LSAESAFVLSSEGFAVLSLPSSVLAASSVPSAAPSAGISPSPVTQTIDTMWVFLSLMR
jgi:hypothetical protein